MARPVLSICRRCEPENGDGTDSRSGEALFQAVKALRKERGLKKVFKLEGVKCLSLCRWGCNASLEGKKRSTYIRSELDPERDVEALITAACAYAELEPGQELPERRLPGVSGD
jgi:predicted metal-binding protein